MDVPLQGRDTRVVNSVDILGYLTQAIVCQREARKIIAQLGAVFEEEENQSRMAIPRIIFYIIFSAWIDEYIPLLEQKIAWNAAERYRFVPMLCPLAVCKGNAGIPDEGETCRSEGDIWSWDRIDKALRTAHAFQYRFCQALESLKGAGQNDHTQRLKEH